MFTPQALTTITRFARALRRELVARGCEPTAVLGRETLPEYVPFEEAKEIWRRAEEQTKDPSIGLAAARQHRSGDFGAVEFAAVSSITLRGAFERMSRFHRLFNSGTKVELAGDSVHYLWPIAPTALSFPHLDFVVGTWFKLCGSQHDEGRLLSALELPLASPEAPRHEAFFDCPVRFGADHTVLHFAPGVLDTVRRDGNEELASSLDAHAQRSLDDLEPSLPNSAATARVIERLLPDGSPRLEDAAVALGLTPRTLRARLVREGTTFTKLVEEIRKQRALSWVEQRELPLEQISFLLGFSEPSAFFRAYRRWTGMTPRGKANKA